MQTGTNDESGACNEALVPRTGCTECYPPGECEGTLQDGDLQRGLSWPIPRFTENGDGTVTDNLTTLVWLKNANCSGAAMNWADALEFANSLHYGWTGDGSGGDCGLSDGSKPVDWRIPNINELLSLVDYRYDNPALSMVVQSASAGNVETAGKLRTSILPPFPFGAAVPSDFS